MRSTENLRLTNSSRFAPVLVSLNDGFGAIGIGRTKGYELINDGTLETVTIGKRRFIKVSSLQSLAEAGTED